MESIDILIFGNGCDHLVFIDMVRQRELDQNTVDSIISIEFSYQIKQFFLRDVSRFQNSGIVYSDHFGGLCLAFHV